MNCVTGRYFSESHKIKKIVHILYTKDFTRLIHRPNDYSAHRL